MLLKILAVWFLTSGLIIAFHARRALPMAWTEPVLKRPVLIIESDDWGAGPDLQSESLEAISRILAGFSDPEGRHPVMTLGIILASADGEKIKSTGSYHRQAISVTTHGSLLRAMHDGAEAGVFSLQLHGLEHFWPPALMMASESNKPVRDWLYSAPVSITEDLPSHLQSRWISATSLPAKSLGNAEISQAVKEEIGCFKAVFGTAPRVAVPPTFIWNKSVETAWSEGGIDVVVTPGARYESRDAAGRPSAAGEAIYNGQVSDAGAVYMVRNSYFEPSLGHTAEIAITALDSKTRLGRPALLETHRFNFLGSEDKKTHSMEELKRFLQQALDKYPTLAFLSTGQLADILRDRDPAWVEQRLRGRLHFCIQRLGEIPGLRKLALLSGWIVPAGLVWRLTGRS
jgi:hypothetical protein